MNHAPLKPCPCCNSPRVRLFTGHHHTKEQFWQIYCKSCQLRTAPEASKNLALITWNTRKYLEQDNEPDSRTKTTGDELVRNTF